MHCLDTQVNLTFVNVNKSKLTTEHPQNRLGNLGLILFGKKRIFAEVLKAQCSNMDDSRVRLRVSLLQCKETGNIVNTYVQNVDARMVRNFKAPFFLFRY